MTRARPFTFVASAVGGAAILFACVGDDPAPATPASDGGGGIDAPVQPDTGSSGGDAGGDAGPPCVPTAAKKLPGPGMVAWTGSDYGVAWSEVVDGYPELMFAKMDADGNVVGIPLQVTKEGEKTDGGTATPVNVHGLVWAGGQFAVLFGRKGTGGYEIVYTTMTAAGARGIGDVVITSSGIGPGVAPPRMAWTGAELGFTWVENGVQFQRRIPNSGEVTPAGAAPLRVNEPDSGPITHPAVTSGYGVAWRDDRNGGDAEIYFARIDPGGNKLGADVRVSNSAGASIRPTLAKGGSGFGIAWDDQRFGGSNHEIMFVRIDAAGAIQGTELRVTDDPSIAIGQQLIWTGGEFGLAWQDGRSGNDEVWLTRIDGATGGKVQPDDVNVSDSTTPSALTTLWWSGNAYGLAWTEQIAPQQYEGWFRVVCP